MMSSLNAASLSGKTAFVTGSTGGIGLAIAQRLAAQGCHVVMHGLESEDVVDAQIKSTRGAEGRAGRVLYVQADVQHPSEIERVFAEIQAQLGGVDILVNNAVTRFFSPVESFPVEKWDLAMAVNVTAAFHTIRLALPLMRERGWGRIINMASVYGLRGTPNRIDYVTSKSALIGMTRAVAAEVVDQGVTCNAICPGTVLTPNIESRIQALMTDKKLERSAAEKEFLRGKQPGGQIIPADHIARMAAYLCEPEAAHINGAVMPVENGWLAL
jgi:3-hydroxybutyrate dehydrogenase